MASTVKVGNDARGNSVYTPMKNLLPMLDPSKIVWGGWDITTERELLSIVETLNKCRNNFLGLQMKT